MTLQRILTAAVLIPLVVFAVLRGPTWLIAILVTVTIVLALREFFDLAARAGLSGHAKWTLTCSLLLVASQFLAADVRPFIVLDTLAKMIVAATFPPLLPDFALIVFVLGVALLSFRSEAPPRDTLDAMAISSAGVVFVAFPLSFLVRLHGVEFVGPRLVLFLLVLIWVGDTFAYFAGRWFGHWPMAPHVSPHKTWEGAAANLAGSLLVAVIFSHWMSFRITHLLAAATLGNIAGQLGDLMESAYKRAAGVKDSSTLLPGHGGILDRIDSLIFAAPVVWYYFSVIVERHL